MNILIANDDGINAEGIIVLARHAKKFGNVTVVAPANQCSAMSQRITIFEDLEIKICDFPVDGVKAFSVSGTPADCVMTATDYLAAEKPDIVFSGINSGYNVGLDIAYSGTIGAASEALMRGIPAIAFSKSHLTDFELVEKELDGIIEELLKTELPANSMWNVNFPQCGAADCKGILRNRSVARTTGYYNGVFVRAETDKGFYLTSKNIGADLTHAAEDSDVRAVMENYISIGTYTPGVLA